MVIGKNSASQTVKKKKPCPNGSSCHYPPPVPEPKPVTPKSATPPTPEPQTQTTDVKETQETETIKHKSPGLPKIKVVDKIDLDAKRKKKPDEDLSEDIKPKAEKKTEADSKFRNLLKKESPVTETEELRTRNP